MPNENSNASAHSEQEYIEFEPFLDCDRDLGQISCRNVKILTTRKPQMCVSLSSGSHEIPTGTRARKEGGYVADLQVFGSFYICLACCDREMEPGFWESQVVPDAR